MRFWKSLKTMSRTIRRVFKKPNYFYLAKMYQKFLFKSPIDNTYNYIIISTSDFGMSKFPRFLLVF